MTTLSFLGAVDTVTGSRYLVRDGATSLLVDCGLFQGPKKLRERNWQEPSWDVAALDAVLLTHAHVDHTGYLPRLCKAGYRGPIYCTAGTRDLLQLLLPDAGYLQEEEAAHANRTHYSRHQPALPLFTREDAERCLPQLVAVDRHAPVRCGSATATFQRAGHIIGASSIVVRAGGTTITFSGDVGRPRDPIMRPPEPLGPSDYLVIESTYGDRRHPDDDLLTTLARIIVETVEKRGTILVPSFAVGRSQHLLHLIAELRAANRIPDVPVFLDSPMAIDATRIFSAHADDHALTPAECAAMSSVASYARDVEASKDIDRSPGPKIVISASGMCTGGRVLHHLCRFLPDEHATVLFIGFQAAGTRGRTLVDGAQELKLLGQYVRVRARIARLDGLSAHADAGELIEWLSAGALKPRQVFVTHGEPAASDALRRRIRDTLGWAARVPEVGETVTL